MTMGGLGGGAIYLHGDTANVDPTLKRLHTLAAAFAVRHARIGADVEKLKASIFVLQVDTPEDLWRVVDERVPPFLKEQPVRLIVIDSLAGLYRGTGDAPHGVHQAEMAKERARHVQRLALAGRAGGNRKIGPAPLPR